MRYGRTSSWGGKMKGALWGILALIAAWAVLSLLAQGNVLLAVTAIIIFLMGARFLKRQE